MQHSLQLLRAALLLIVLSLVSGNAFAQKPYSFSPSGPVVIRSADGEPRTDYVMVTNETDSALTIYVSYRGDTSLYFLYNQYNSFTIGADSTAGFPVRYRPSFADTSIGYVRISDNVNAPDSVMFIGIDTTEPVTWDVSAPTLVMGSYYQAPDSASLTIYNYTNNEITVNMSILSGSYGIDYSGPGSRTIAANSSTSVLFLYASNMYNSAQAIVRLTSLGRVKDVGIYGRKMLPPRDSLYWQWQYSFDTVQAGDTVCRTVYIINPFDSSATITSFSLPNNAPFYISNPPSLPLSLAGNDTLQLTVCYTAPNSGNQTSYSYINVDYQFAGDSARSHQIYLRGTTARCLILQPAYLSFQVLRDSVMTQAVYVHNRSGSSISLDADFDQSGGGHFEVVTSMPINVAAYDSAAVQIRFTATGATSQYAKLIFDGGTGCGTEDLALTARIIDTNIVIDSTAIALFGDETRELDFIGDSNNTTITYRFYNDQTDSITVVSIALKDGTRFTITDVAPHMPWFKLAQNGLMEVTIQFDGTPGTYTDTLVIVTENGVIALNFPINAVISSSDVSTPAFSTATMSVSPNPSTGPVTISIDQANTATIEVLDIMGTRIAQFKGAVATFDRNNLAAGTYFVRASGIGADRKPFVITQRVVLK